MIYLASGDITIDEFTAMMNQYVPTSTLGLRDLFNTFGRRKYSMYLFFESSVTFCFVKIKDLSGDGAVDKQEFDQVMKEKGDELNQDQINIFNKIFQQDENSKVTYERMSSLFDPIIHYKQ